MHSRARGMHVMAHLTARGKTGKPRGDKGSGRGGGDEEEFCMNTPIVITCTCTFRA